MTYAFGIEIEAAFEAPGLPEGSSPVVLPRAVVERVAPEAVDDAWSDASPERILEENFGGGSAPDRTIDRDPDLGYRLYARHFGTALISPGGEHVLCAPPAVAAWRWQRFLVGRVLPWTALLRGRELIHASAVRIGDHAIAFAAETGVGKTSLAVQHVLRGATLLTDDVLAIEPTEDALLAHPGASIVAVRPGEKEAIERREWLRLGKVLGVGGKTYVNLPREPAPVSLGAIYFVTRGSGATGIEAGADARQILASAFIAGVSSPERLVGLLDLASQISARVPTFQLRIGADSDARRAAEMTWEHAAGLEIGAG